MKQDKEYWQRRCELAEAVIAVSKMENSWPYVKWQGFVNPKRPLPWFDAPAPPSRVTLRSNVFNHGDVDVLWSEPVLEKTTRDIGRSLVIKKESLLEKVLLNEGFAATEEFISGHISCKYGLGPDDEVYDHYYYHYGKPDQKRLISFGQHPHVTFSGNSIFSEVKYY